MSYQQIIEKYKQWISKIVTTVVKKHWRDVIGPTSGANIKLLKKPRNNIVALNNMDDKYKSMM